MSGDSQCLEITLPVGQLKGVLRKSIYDDNYYSFEGIPYGQPPVGELRFKAPVPTEPWTGIKDCTDFKTKPIQKNPMTGIVEGSEDCLYLNVYAKTLNSKTPLPVMVWIYGGSFLFGEATRNMYSPDYFMSEEVIVVTLNYRLCSLGFLSVEDPSVEVAGNAGLKDQILALKWVKEYIQYFNGDPNNITLFGNSAGSASTHFLTAARQTKGLFQKAICLSGTMLNPWSITPPKDYVFRLAKQHGYTGENIDKQVVEFLRSLEPAKLANEDVLNDEDKRCGVSFAFGPCIEPYDSEHCVVPEDPRIMMKTAWSNDIPIIFSGTSDEGLLMYPKVKMFPQLLKVLSMDPERVLPYEVRANNAKEKNLEMAKTILKQHFGNKTPDENALTEMIYYFGIKTFWHGIHRSVLSRLALAKAPTYVIRFAFDSPTYNHHRKRFCGDDIKTGVAHADDISYLWHSFYSWKLDKASQEYKTISKMVKIFVNIAKTSNLDIQEVQADDQEGDPQMWKPLDVADPFEALNITDKLQMKTIPEKEDLLAWDLLYEQGKLF